MRSLADILKHIPVGAPLLHVLSCFIFLYGYDKGFGAGIGQLFSPSNFFSVSFSDLATIYATSVLIPAAIFYKELSADYISPMQKAINDGNEEEVARIRKLTKFSLGAYNALLAFISLLFILQLVAYFIIDHEFPFVFLSWMLMASISFWISSSKIFHKLSLQQTIFLVLLISLVISSFCAGASRGQYERRQPASLFARNMQCEGYRVLRPVGENYLSVTGAGERLIVTTECKAVLRVPKRDELPRSAPIPALWRHWRS